MAHSDWDSPYSPRAVRIHIVRRTGAPAAQHPFLGHPWCLRDSDRGIAWGVLATPSIRDLLRVVRGQDVEEEINSPRYLIGATGEGATRLCQDPEEPLQLRQLILLNRDDNIRAWFLANNGHDPRDLMVLESRPEDREDPDETAKPPNGRHQFFDREVWDDSAGAEYAIGRCRRRRSGLTRMNGYRPSRREQLGRLLVLALSLWTTATYVSKQNRHTGQARIADY